MQLANFAAGAVVEKLGTATASPEEILAWLDPAHEREVLRPLLSVDEAGAWRGRLRARHAASSSPTDVSTCCTPDTSTISRGRAARRRADRRLERDDPCAGSRASRVRSCRSPSGRRCCSRCAASMPSSGSGERTPELLLDRIRPDVHVKSDQYVKTSCPNAASSCNTAVASRSRRTSPDSTTDTSRASSMRIAVTANGPGEVAGWLRPLLRALYQRAPDLWCSCFWFPTIMRRVSRRRWFASRFRRRRRRAETLREVRARRARRGEFRPRSTPCSMSAAICSTPRGSTRD